MAPKPTPHPQDWTPEGVGLARDQYAAALRYLFDRPVPGPQGHEWYWDDDPPGFTASPLEWTRIQTALFANSGTDLVPFSDEQVGMGLNYLLSNAISEVPFAVIHASVPSAEALRMMQAMPILWRDCFGRRLAHLQAPIGSVPGRLAYVCYMWFDVWPTFSNVRDVPWWREALWQVFCEMLQVPCREVQVAALHGIGHEGRSLRPQGQINALLDRFLRSSNPHDVELRQYADAARRGEVQ